MSEEQNVSQKFVESIKAWVAIDDRMLKLKEELKKLNTEKKEYEVKVLAELDKMDQKMISISDGKLKKNVTKTQAPLKKDTIQKTLFDLTKDEKKTFDIIEQMMKSRPVVEKVNLKRTKNSDSFIKKNIDKDI